jgi:hypothetical protein
MTAWANYCDGKTAADNVTSWMSTAPRGRHDATTEDLTSSGNELE